MQDFFEIFCKILSAASVTEVTLTARPQRSLRDEENRRGGEFAIRGLSSPALEGFMKSPFLFLALFAGALLGVQPAHAQNAFTPDQIKWGPAPPFVQPGAQLAVLEGDPMAS